MIRNSLRLMLVGMVTLPARLIGGGAPPGRRAAIESIIERYERRVCEV
jgi:hypothetical protein